MVWPNKRYHESPNLTLKLGGVGCSSRQNDESMHNKHGY